MCNLSCSLISIAYEICNVILIMASLVACMSAQNMYAIFLVAKNIPEMTHDTALIHMSFA